MSSGNKNKNNEAAAAATTTMEGATEDTTSPRKRQRKEPPPQKEEETKASKKEKGWMHFYNKLVAYKAKHGSVEVPQRYKDDPALGSWCKNQREYYKNFCNNKTSSLTQERIDLLNEIGFAWLSTKTKRRVVKDFDLHFEELQEFKRENGHTRVPHVYDANPGLGVFCHRCKIYYREMQEGKRKTPNDWLTPQRIQALDDVEFEWKVGKFIDMLVIFMLFQFVVYSLVINLLTGRWKTLSWEERYAQLVHFHSIHGHVHVTKEYDEEHPGLKLWVTNQRTYLMRVPASNKRVASAVALSEEKKELLQNLGVEFSAPKQATATTSHQQQQ